MPAPSQIIKLVERFDQNRDAYLSSHYNETQLRREFLDPFFEALGWDVDNKKGYAEAYKDVIHEDAIKVGGTTKAPDYCFRIGGTRKFFVEAKKPSVNLKEEIEPAFQLRRYAWSAKLPLSILTDFEEFAVYDCRIAPAKTDKASAGRLLYLTSDQYTTKWNEIESIFSRESIFKGSFDKYAESTKGKRGTAEVDSVFLKEIEAWRDELARNIALRNPRLSQRELNFAVQRTIDRIIFLRICEDRAIETYCQLQVLCNGTQVYKRLCELFQRADQRYNSGLFHFEKEKERLEPPDDLTLGLSIDDKPLKDIIKNLYYPDSPYEFSVLPADILGQVYEQFLGKVIRLTPAHHAVVEDKPEVKKAGGVYYTPTYIVDYIVKNTVGKLVGQTSSSASAPPEEKPGEDRVPALQTKKSTPQSLIPKQVARLRILDPACGSGSFLIGAYQYLLDWHRDWYLNDGPAKHTKEIYEGPGGSWRLTTAERKRILLNNIYGVDIDPQAVEVTKLSLLLKVLEGESDQTLSTQFRLFHERALPDLGSNIKCGNSLIGPDFYAGQQMSLLDDEDRYLINAFDWNTEFAGIMKAGGFDAVLGNPPYVRQETLAQLKDYFAQHYRAFNGTADLYVYFIERGMHVLREHGFLSVIVSSSFLRANYAEQLRELLGKKMAVLQLIDFGGLAVFENAKDTYVSIPVFRKQSQPETIDVCKIESLDNLNVMNYVAAHKYKIPASQLTQTGWPLDHEPRILLFKKIMALGVPLGQYVERRFFRGVTTGLNKAFIIDSATRRDLINQDEASALIIKPLLAGEDIRRWGVKNRNRWLIFTRRGIDIDMYPAVKVFLSRFKEELTPKQTKDQKHGRKPGRYKWYEIQDDVAYFPIFEKPKIIFPDITKEPRFFLDTSGSYLANTAYTLGSADLYLLGILNSPLCWFAISNISIPFGIRAGKYRYRLIYQYMEKVPIRLCNLRDDSEKDEHDRIVSLVQRMMVLNQESITAKTEHEKISLQRQIGATDDEINQLVYRLYHLTKDEIETIEEITNKT